MHAQDLLETCKFSLKKWKRKLIFSAWTRAEKSAVRSAAKLMANVLFNRRYAPLITQTIVGGLDEEGPSLYVLDVLGSLIPDKYAVVGSGTEIAIGVLEEGYKEDMNAKEMKELVMRAVKSAISRDSMSGDGIDFLIITKEGITEESVKF